MLVRWYLAYSLSYRDIEELARERGLSVDHSIINRRVIRQNKYLNNRVEQDHRGIKKITKAMLGFKSFASAEATLAGIELHRMLKKGQHQNAANQPVYKQFYALAA